MANDYYQLLIEMKCRVPVGFVFSDEEKQRIYDETCDTFIKALKKNQGFVNAIGKAQKEEKIIS